MATGIFPLVTEPLTFAGYFLPYLGLNLAATADFRVTPKVHARRGIRLSPSLDLGLRYFYLDVFDPVRLHQGGVVLRRVF